MADYRFSAMEKAAPKAVAINAFMRGVYMWMTLGLGLTAAVAFVVQMSTGLQNFLMQNQMVFFGLIIAELGLVVAISAGIKKLSAGTASGLFLLYSALNGLTIGAILLLYTAASVATAFLTCAGMFAAMSVYGMTTKRDLTSWGSFLFMGLIGIIIASIVNIFIGSSMMHFVISVIGVIVFTGLTAYDTQKLKYMGETAPEGDTVALKRGMILGALSLYLDFINLFLMLLRLFGAARD
jgi:FtsH-binding integral membrane protein